MNPTKNSANQSSAAASPASLARRKFINSFAAAAGGGCLLALGAGLWARQASALPAQAIRPPGALAEDDFLAACVRCGLCVRDCPYDTLKLSDLGDSVATGTPLKTGSPVASTCNKPRRTMVGPV